MAVMVREGKRKIKHLSKGNKKKQFKKGKKEFKSIGKRGRLILRNLPFKCSEEEIHSHFSDFGEIKDINLLRRPDNKLVGCGFIEFTSRLDADRAKDQLNGKPFLGRPIYIDRAVSQNNYTDTNKEENEEINNKDLTEAESLKEEKKIRLESLFDKNNETKIKQENPSSGEEDEGSETTSKEKMIGSSKQNDKTANSSKKSRLIIRNLSFKTTEEKLKEHFSKFGEVTEVKLLRKPDNSLVGCGFVQYLKKTEAAKAIHYTSGKPFLDRPIIVDWAIAKNKFQTNIQLQNVKKEIKEEMDSEDDFKKENSKQSLNEDNSEKSASDSEEEDSDEEEEEESEEESNDNSSGDDEEDIQPRASEEEQERLSRRQSDVDEGKTVFVKNLPFSATDEEFRECVEQFGPVFYALICKDKLTEHSKGSGFVKFKEKDHAQKCLSAGTEFTLKGNILDPHPALKRNEAQKLHEKAKEKKDNRNLYLVKEGMIIAGTPAAKGVSVSDMERRLQLEQWKTARLRDLNMFVSQNRLVVHNLPETMGDKQLQKLFKKHAGSNAVVKEARVMRDLKRVDDSGKGVSKGFGFVSFEKHEHALKALRSINNNPSIFTPTARPIVSFSIENRRVLNTKTKRMVRSRQKNPLCKDFKPEETEAIPPKKTKHSKVAGSDSQEEPNYAGITVKPGSTVKMRQSYKLKNQAQQHLQDVRKHKREMKMTRQTRRAEHMKQKQIEKKLSKKNKNKAGKDVAFTSLVDKYKTKLLSQAMEKKKWYDD